MRILICGLGSVGRRHLNNLLELGFDDIVFLRSGRSTLPEDQLPEFPTASDIHQALEQWSPQAAIVANPTALHLEVALPAAEHGCSLLIEKPISHSLAGIERLSKALGRGGGRALVGYQYRFNAGLRQVRALLDSGRLGRAISARAHWGEDVTTWHPWEDYRQSYSVRADLGGGVLVTLSHPFDYLRWLLGEPESVWAELRSDPNLESDVESVAEVGLSFRSGAVGSVHLDYLQNPPGHSLEITGTDGYLRWEAYDSRVEFTGSDGEGAQSFEPPEGYRRNQMFVDELRHFVDLVQHGGQPACDISDGTRALEIALAARQSFQTGQRIPVEHAAVV